MVVAEDFLQDAQVRQWLDGVEPAWTLLTFDSLRALRQEPSASQTAIRIANDLSGDEIAGSAMARNTLILLRQAIERGGLPLTATGNLSRAVVAEMRELIEQMADLDPVEAEAEVYESYLFTLCGRCRRRLHEGLKRGQTPFDRTFGEEDDL